MNPVEIKEAVSALAERPFDAGEFPHALMSVFKAWGVIFLPRVRWPGSDGVAWEEARL